MEYVHQRKLWMSTTLLAWLSDLTNPWCVYEYSVYQLTQWLAPYLTYARMQRWPWSGCWIWLIPTFCMYRRRYVHCNIWSLHARLCSFFDGCCHQRPGHRDSRGVVVQPHKTKETETNAGTALLLHVFFHRVVTDASVAVDMLQKYWNTSTQLLGTGMIMILSCTIRLVFLVVIIIIL